LGLALGACGFHTLSAQRQRIAQLTDTASSESGQFDGNGAFEARWWNTGHTFLVDGVFGDQLAAVIF
jgi:hypothetical protein